MGGIWFITEPLQYHFDTDRAVAVMGGIRGQLPGDIGVSSEGIKQLFGTDRVGPNVLESE